MGNIRVYDYLDPFIMPIQSTENRMDRCTHVIGKKITKYTLLLCYNPNPVLIFLTYYFGRYI